MKTNHIGWRSKGFEVTAKARKVASLETMVIDFQHMALELARQISAEEERTASRTCPHRLFDIGKGDGAASCHHQLGADLRAKLDTARSELEAAEAELRALEPVETRNTDRQLRKIGRTDADARPN
jgi:hypothetical protein